MYANPDAYEELTRDLMEAVGSVVVGVTKAARLADCSTSKVRGAISRGELAGSRCVTNGPIKIRIRELARWIIDGEKRSLPEPDCEIDGFDFSDGAGS